MKKFFASFVILGLLAGIIASTGCGYQTKEADLLIKEANRHTAKGNSLQKKINATSDKLGKIPNNKESIKKGLKMFGEIQKQAKQAKKEVEQSINNFKKALALDISKKLKKYINMELTALEAKLDSDKTQVKLFDKSIIVLKKVLANDIDAEGDKLVKELDKLDKKQVALDDKYDELKEKADSYYNRHQGKF